jgi:DNA-binding MarR family transcriptional regulator
MGKKPNASKRSHSTHIQEAIELFKQFMSKMSALSQPAWLDSIQLTLGQIRTIMFLQKEKTSTVGCVAECLGICEPTASQLVDRLVRAGLVQRTEDPADRRRSLLSLSPKGKKLVEERLHAHRERLRALFERMRDKDLASLCSGLRAILDAMDAQTANRKTERKYGRGD